MDFNIYVINTTLRIGEYSFPCSIGRGGIAVTKKEGDGCTPVGEFHLRKLFYRPDRLEKPQCRLETRPLEVNDGWCDDPDDLKYNQAIKLPYSGRHEELWRADHLYDLIVVIGYNDSPVISGAGSAIFLHVATKEFSPTAGCVALCLHDLILVLDQVQADSTIIIQGETPSI